MNLPKSVKIGGLTYRVKQTSNVSNGVDGEINPQTLKIKLRPMNKAAMARTLLHEMLHGIHWELGYTEHDEKQIDALAGALYALIVDNPGIFIDG